MTRCKSQKTISPLSGPALRYCAIMNGKEVHAMKPTSREPSIPVEMHDTVRREIIAVLEQGERSARDLSSEVGISEKEVYSHLEHIRKTMSATGRHLAITPAECRKCGFVFSKRERLKKPGKCPVCKGESIHVPLFFIEENRQSRQGDRLERGA